MHEYCELSQGDGLSNISNRSSFFMGLLRERISGAHAAPEPGLGAEPGRSEGSGRSWGWGRRVGRGLGRSVGRGVG